LDQTASFLGLVEENIYDVSKLLPVIVQQANGGALRAPLAFSGDVVTSEMGPAALTREFAATITGRNQVGPFGAGWTLANGFALTAVTLADGSVAIRSPDGSEAIYTARSFGGGFVSLAGDGSTLTAAGGNYTVHYADGRAIEFAIGGIESSIDDGQGHHVNA